MTESNDIGPGSDDADPEIKDPKNDDGDMNDFTEEEDEEEDEEKDEDKVD